MVVLERVQRFLAAVAVDPAPDSAELTVYEDLGYELGRRLRAESWNATTLPATLEAIGYRPGPLVAEVALAMGASGEQSLCASGSTGYLFRWTWRRERPFDPGPLIAIYRRHEADRPMEIAPGRRAVGLTLSYWFEVKRPGTDGPLFPGAELRSSVMIFVGGRGANLSLRYDSPDMTPALREAHTEIVAALGPKTPRHALQRIIPATRPGGRERREPIS